MRQKMKSIRAALIIWCLLLPTSISFGAISPQERKRIEDAIPEKAPAAAKRARKLLVFNMDIRDGVVRKGHTSIPYGNLAIEMMGRKTKAYETVVSSDIAMFRPENIRQFDAICFNNTTGVLFEDAELKKSLLNFISEGKGFIGIHAAAATFVQWPKYDQWPQFGEMLGGYENGGHPWKYNEWITIKLDEPDHKLNAAFKGKGFRISDEVFQFQKPYSRDKLRVLLSIDMEKTKIISGRLILPERRKDKDFAVSWIRGYGKGRVFYCFLGHNPQTFWNPPILQHYLAGIQFALGDLPADTTPSNKARQNTDRPRPTYADVAYGPHERNVIDFYKVDSDKPTPLVVYFHGGGWRNGSKKDLKHKFCRPVMESGIAFAAANYRLTGHAPHPAQLHDAARAIQFLRSKAVEWNIDPNRIAVYGGSAGGSISLWLALHDDMAEPTSDDPVARQSSRLSCAIGINAQSTNDPRVIRKIIPGKAYNQSALKPLFGLPADWNWDTAEVSDELSARLIDGSPISHLTEDDPPVFVYHTEQSEVHGNIHHPNFGRYLKKNMDAMNIECVFRMSSDYKRWYEDRNADFLAFLRKHFRMKDAK